MMILNDDKTIYAITKYKPGDVVKLFGFDDFRAVVTSFCVRSNGAIDYQVEWPNNGEMCSEWIEEHRIASLAKLTGN